MVDDIITFAYQLYRCDIITLEEYNKVIETVVNDRLNDIKELIGE